MNLADLNKVAVAMTANGRGILAADESTGTIKKRFDAINTECTEDNRRDYREMLFRAAEGMILDVGSQSIERIKGAIDEAATLVWNGPMGAFEMHPFEKATVEIAKYAAARTKAGKLVSVAGGGDTVAALNAAGVAEQFTYVSTAGGAFLEWMEGKALPGVEVLRIK
jgi:3-phosphoglycerate kinase